MKLEIIATSLQDARAAERAGADRLELCSALTEGGLTPSLGMIEAVVEGVSIPVHVIVRPHSRTFHYDEEDIQVMLADIRHIRQTKAAGIVIGILDKTKRVDTVNLKRFLDAAGDLNVTFHRAFDEIEDQLEAVATIGNFPQIQRILTSGGPAPAPESIEEIRELVVRTENTSVTILAGNGMTPDGLTEFIEATGVTEVHFGSAVRERQSFQYPIIPEVITSIKSMMRK
ncbi:copper homeostasis protein CutC [Sporosarcina gallistercoris]|uniref:PF03932 family protein CutC n=1 Tax=Sporosarcina gallistercoris TaxID=2762245 RepID=A0ABR8PJV7_9BACL|nr:copper homeostasis protein CutC [Sporosarcina gallistercoris]MBD7908425.1 copper homeostasis protein CutC [Sporosarcina gallistercoris]